MLIQAHSDFAVRDKDGRTFLSHAAIYGQPEVLKWILERDRELLGRTDRREVALYLAAKSGQTEVVELLLSAGADPEIRCNDDACPTPLYVAAQNGHHEVVKLLLAAQANPAVNDWRDRGNTALHCAARNNHKEIVKILLDGHASIADTNIVAAASLAERLGHHELAEFMKDQRKKKSSGRGQWGLLKRR